MNHKKLLNRRAALQERHAALEAELQQLQLNAASAIAQAARITTLKRQKCLIKRQIAAIAREYPLAA